MGGNSVASLQTELRLRKFFKRIKVDGFSTFCNMKDI